MAKILRTIAIGAAVAGAAGYVAGMLSAPKSGKATREDLKKSAGSGFGDFEKQLKHLQNELQDIIGSAKDSGSINKESRERLEQLVGKATDSKDKVQDVVHAIKSGKADDKDLKKAIKDARRAIEHIRDFISK